MGDQPLTLRITLIAWETDTVRRFELRPPGGGNLPAFEAGAHLTLQLTPGLARSYSLMNSPRERHRYEIAVALEPNGRGGSRYCHETLRVGDVVTAAPPRNAFSLAQSDAPALLLGGGIGVTPLISMARALAEASLPFRLIHAVRTRDAAPFREILAAFGDDATLHVDDDHGGVLPLAELVATAPEGAHIYACGPRPMLEALACLTRRRPAGAVHTENFAGGESVSESDAGFSIELARSGRILAVGPDQSILAAIEAAGVAAVSSCRQGVCGMCETTILAGEADHRDSLLTPDERAANRTLMICCSRSRSARLVLDL